MALFIKQIMMINHNHYCNTIIYTNWGNLMNDYVIFTDATCDINSNIFDELDVQVIPMDFEMNGESYTHYLDGRELSSETFFQRIKAGEMANTSQINMMRYFDFFTPYLEAGKDIVYLCFSSALSGTYQSSVLATNELLEKYPNRKIKTIDTLSASGGQALLVYMAAQKKIEGMSFDELSLWVEENRLHICHWFTVDDLYCLKRHGRIGAISATFGTALSIKPLLHVDQEGKLALYGKIRGKKNCITKLMEQMRLSVVDPVNDPVFITHADNLEEAKALEAKIREEFHTKTVIISNMGPVIGAHTGSGTLVLTFYGKER